MTAPHIPVMASEVVTALAPRAGGLYVDGTFGAGGYTRAILSAAPCRVIGIDRDPTAIEAGRALGLSGLTLIEGRFGELDRLASDPVDGVALDLGVSSMQLDRAERGFSFRFDGPLDMRMETSGPSAADLVAELPAEALADIIWRLGEERHSRRIARAIVQARTAAPIRTTAALAGIVRGCLPRAADGIDPATRTFQALRIAVNDELGELDRGLAAAERALKPGGRLAVVTFHSLEDRAVKSFLQDRSGTAPTGSRHLPAANAPAAPTFRLVGRKPVTPSPAEIAANPRARSAKLRAAERTDAPAWSLAA